MTKPTRLLPRLRLTWVLTSVVVLGSIGLVGCGATPFTSLGPQEPLLPAIEGQSKFSDRFQLEEVPQFFYDLFGKELLEGNEVHQYIEQKQFDDRGNLVQGWSGQLDSSRFTLQLDRQILTEDTFRGRHAEAAIGDHLRIKPETLFPAGYIMRKTEFDGHRFDFSFSHERHLFTLLNSRISNTIYFPQTGGGGQLSPTSGRRTSTEDGAWLGNAHLVGFRAQGLIGDVFRVGVTYLNLRQEFHQRIDNPWQGSVANTPPEVVVMVFRDDSPEDGRVGAAFKQMEVVIRYQERRFDVTTIDVDPNSGEPLEEPLVVRTPIESDEEEITWTVTADMMVDGALGGAVLDGGELDGAVRTDMPAGIAGVDSVEGYPFFGSYRVANGFDAFHYAVDLRQLPPEAGVPLINPAVVKSIEFRSVEVAGDYNIVVNGYSSLNVGDDEGPLLGMNEAGLIQAPYRDVIQASGNIGQDNYDAAIVNNPDQWDPKVIPSIKYGAARAGTIVGVDLEGTVGNVLIRAQYSINNKYKTYPTVSEDKIDWSLLAADPGLADPTASDFVADQISEGRTFSANDGEEFKFQAGGANNDGPEVAWFVQLKHRLGRILFEESFYHVDPGYTTNYFGWGSNSDRDEPYNIPRTPGSEDDTDPYDAGIYHLVEDDDDNDDWPDDDDFDGVLPQADDRDLNGVLDYLEDFLIFDADPPVFDDLVDLDNNGIIDSLEDDFEPDYEFGIDREGYHVNAQWDIFDNMTLGFGWLNETEVSSARRNNTKYLQFDFRRDIAELGTFNLQNRLRLVQDDIPDYGITLRVGQVDVEEIPDKLDFFNARENTTTLQFLYNAIPNLTVEVKYLLTLGKQSPADEERAISLDNPDTESFDERIDLMVPIDQVQTSGGLRNYPWFPDPQLIYDFDNWEGRRYGVRSFRDQETGDLVIEEGKTIKQQLGLFKIRYEIPLTNLPGIGNFVSKISEDMVITPLYKYIFENYSDRNKEELPVVDIAPFEGPTRMALDPLRIDPDSAQSQE
ncbi:MAG: hypothetical protein O3A46_04865, partial [Candidatus Poribacteria bacterium]|nr:hypothetical protein [Candidatus Poribacteria bacterium]